MHMRSVFERNLGAILGMDTLIVGDVRLYREGLAQVLRDAPHISVVGTAPDPESAFQSVVELSPEVVLLDTTMSRALEIAQRIHDLAPDAKIIALGVVESEAQICASAEAGVAAFVTRDASLDCLLETITAASRSEFQCSPHTAAVLLRHIASLAHRSPSGPPAACLTRRQAHVLDLLSRGQSNKEIARNLGIGVATVKNHVHQILERLRVSRRGEAAALWLRQRRLLTSYSPTNELD